MTAVNRSAAGRWYGVSQGGGSAGTSGRSSRARAARAATAAGAADASAPSRRANGSAGVSRCSDRIRGGAVERTAVGGIEVEQLGDESFVGRAAGAIRREPWPTGRCACRHGQLPHDAGVEPPEAAASGVGGEACDGGVSARVEEPSE